MPEAVSPLNWGSLWCHGLVRCACHEASARALQGFVPCGEGNTAPSLVLPTGCLVCSPERPVALLLVFSHAHAAALHDRVAPRSHTESCTEAGQGGHIPLG